MKNAIKITIIIIILTIAAIFIIVIAQKDKDTIAINNNSYENKNKYINGIWIRTVLSLDFPKTTSIEGQKKELCEIIYNCKKNNITDIFFQVRPQCDALYKSSINEWSSVLTGVQGKDPGYDPLKFLLKEAKENNINVHAWLNPYRILMENETLEDISDSNFAKSSEDILIYQNNKPYLNPGSITVNKHLEETVKELLENYPSLASIHLDDYFYPSGYSDKFIKDSEEQNLLRENITNMIISLKKICSSYNIPFGVSPSGVWKNSSSDPDGSDTLGNESYYSVCADTKLWVENNYIDYIIPQVYWDFNHKNTPYDIVTKWWSDLITSSNSKTKLYIGQGIYKEEVANEISKQLEFNYSLNNISGSVFYCYEYFFINNNCRNSINDFYNNGI